MWLAKDLERSSAAFFPYVNVSHTELLRVGIRAGPFAHCARCCSSTALYTRDVLTVPHSTHAGTAAGFQPPCFSSLRRLRAMPCSKCSRRTS